MTINCPREAWMPALSAAPYPRSVTRTTRAPHDSAIPIEPSVEPLSATTTSPFIPAFAKAVSAFSMQIATEFASFRHGITTDTSGDCDVWAVVFEEGPTEVTTLVRTMFHRS